MSMPSFKDLMLPLLKAIADNVSHPNREVTSRLADEFRLSEEDRNESLKNGQRRFPNNVNWARVYLEKAGLVETPEKSHMRITADGLAVLQQNPAQIDVKFLKERDPSFDLRRDARTGQADEGSPPDPSSREEESRNPEELLEASWQTLRDELAEQLLARVKACSPWFFEHLVLKVLLALGYGGAFDDAGRTTSRTADGGIDGIIKEDKLGLDEVCIQAKRWEKPVGRPDVQSFAGSMEGRRARKGVFITTSSFTKEALEYVRQIERRIVLVDGRTLAELMIDHNVGVSTTAAYEVKRLDSDYFEETDE